MVKRSLSQLDINGSRVLVRVDFNVPIEQGIEAIAGYDQRLRATLPTIRHLIDAGCRTILCSHLGRPRGKVDEALRLAPIGDRLAFLLEHPVKSLPDVTGPEVEAAVAAMAPGDVALLENLRFDAGEEANDPAFAQSLAALADYFVMDAFAVAHRAHASTLGVTEYLPSAMGFLVEREVTSMGRALEAPEKPLAALMGGAKVSDKILLLENMLDKLDHLFIGGGMCVTFLKAQGHGVGASQVEEDRLEFAREMLDAAALRGIKVHLPGEVVVASEFAPDPCRSPGYGPPTGCRTAASSWTSPRLPPASSPVGCNSAARSFGTGRWACSRCPGSSEGTRVVAAAIADAPGITSVVGGGSTAETVEALGLVDSMTHVSTGGGASLEFLGGLELPGIACASRCGLTAFRTSAAGLGARFHPHPNPLPQGRG